MSDDEPATEPDRAWRERAQKTNELADELQPPPPADPRADPENESDDCKRD
jgi:hypothetical protein